MDLDGNLELMESGGVEEAMQGLFAGAAARKAGSSPEEWREFVVSEVWTHPIRTVVHEDPMTRRVFSKPRGYPGDAVMLDYIYGLPHPEIDRASERGERIRDFNLQTPAARGVRHRRHRLAATIDRVSAELPGARVLALAAGHLREAELSEGLATGRVSELVAFDQDAKSLELVSQAYAHLPVTVRAGTVRNVLSRRALLGEFDLVYAAGLFDYLSQPTGRRLAAEMFRCVRPGGRMLLANFVQGIPGAGYMEAFMDWFLIYRTDAEMLDLLREIEPAEIHQVVLSHDDDQNIVYVEAIRA
jgi:extracellular factor (EF) 3-hydroxypalmitic acid methyl ester biosynthesis protein